MKTEPETWDEKKCERVAKHRSVDGYGSRHPYKGLVSPFGLPEQFRRPLPIIPDSYEFYNIMAWGTFIRKKERK